MTRTIGLATFIVAFAGGCTSADSGTDTPQGVLSSVPGDQDPSVASGTPPTPATGSVAPPGGEAAVGGEAAGGQEGIGGAPQFTGGQEGTGGTSETVNGSGGAGAQPASECPARLDVPADRPCPGPNSLPRLRSLTIAHNSSAYEGELPKCAGFQPVGEGFSFRGRVESLSPYQGAVTTGVILAVANLDETPVCGHAVLIEAEGLRGLDAKVDEVLRFSQRLTLKDDDSDILGTYAVESAEGELLAANVSGARPELFDADLMNDLSLEVGSTPLCGLLPDYYVLGSMTLSAPIGQGSCTVDSHVAAPCCRLWAHEYTVLSQAVMLQRYSGPAPLANFEIYRNDFVLFD